MPRRRVPRRRSTRRRSCSTRRPRSRQPSRRVAPCCAGNGDLLKPDLIAPGQDILAGVAPPNNRGRLFDLYSGTSMSSPHVAGLAALFKQKFPNWSPMAIKSALMTTGYDVLDGGTPAPNTNPVLIFRQGAGHVEPGRGDESGPGLRLGLQRLAELHLRASSRAGAVPACTPTDPSNLNMASIAIGDMAGKQKVTRWLTNVSGKHGDGERVGQRPYGHQRHGRPGLAHAVPGQTKSFTVEFTRTTAALAAYSGGQLTWTGGGFSVRSPIVVRPVALAAPAQVSGSYSVTFGFNGAFTASPRGLIPAAITPGTVADDPTDGACSLTSPNAQLISVNVPAGTTYARFSLFDADVSSRVRHRHVRLQRHHAGRQQRQWHLGRGSQPDRPGSRAATRWWCRVGALPVRARSSCTPGCSTALTLET